FQISFSTLSTPPTYVSVNISMNPVFVRRGFNAAAGFIVPGSMLDNTFVLDSFVAAANNTGGRRRPRNNNNNMGLFSSPVAIDS
ncbi:hypothetical protein L195_g061740, partial [Trifolium pratense]